MITVINTQKAFVVPKKLFVQAIKDMLHTIDFGHYSLSVVLCGSARMKTYNTRFRGAEKATDVISFPAHKSGILAPNKALRGDAAYLGDIVLCPEVINKKRKDWNQLFYEHLLMLTAHAIAHLLGHDHVTDEQYEAMNAVEQKMFAVVKKNQNSLFYKEMKRGKK